MRIVTMDEIFRHLRIEQGVEDDYLMSLGEVAEEMVLRYVNRTDEELRETFGGIPLGVKHACLLVVGSLYRNRESEVVTSSTMNRMFAPLVVKYRKLV